MIRTLSVALNILFDLLRYAIIADVILSWIYRGRTNAIIDFLHIFTEPIMAPARKLQAKFTTASMLDFSPIIAYYMLVLIRYAISALLGI